MKPTILLLAVFTFTPVLVLAGHGINRVGNEGLQSIGNNNQYSIDNSEPIPGHGINRGSTLGDAEAFVEGLEMRLDNQDYLCFPKESLD